MKTIEKTVYVFTQIQNNKEHFIVGYAEENELSLLLKLADKMGKDITRTTSWLAENKYRCRKAKLIINID